MIQVIRKNLSSFAMLTPLYHKRIFFTLFFSIVFCPKVFCDDTLQLTFTGDLMAYEKNQEMRDCSYIYKDLSSVLKHDDLSFINFEAPIDPDQPIHGYPTFNAHPPYLEAAIQGGFEVFSFANNHTNNFQVSSILKTIEVVEGFQKKYPIFWSGLRKTPKQPLQPTIIAKKGWKISFIALTNLVNNLKDA